MDEAEKAKIRDVKRKISGMMEERQHLESGEAAVKSPNEYWSDVCSSFDYMLGLPEESFSNLKVHTYHITGDSYLHYDGHRDSAAFRSAVDLDGMTEGIPPQMVLNEPSGGIGFAYDDGRFVNIDVLRYQRVVNTLYRRGVIGEISSDNPENKNIVLEIGGGYGGLAHQLSNVLGQSTYVIVDLPETLLFSAAYLTLHNPGKSIYLYDSADSSNLISQEEARSYDFVLVPNYKLGSLADWSFALAINMISFQEMSAPQVNEYLDFIRERCTGVLYCWNMDSHVQNTDLLSMAEMLRGRFDFLEAGQPDKGPSRSRRIVDGLRSIASTVGLAKPPQTTGSVAIYITRGREYICKPVPSGRLN